MAQNVSFNGAAYVVPDVSDTVWGASLTEYLVALSTGSLQKNGGLFTLTAEADFGATFALRAAYFKSRGALVANAGVLRLANLENISWRNAANSADLALTVDASGNLLFNGAAIPVAAIGAADTVLQSNGSVPLYALIANANVDASAAIAVTKLAALTASKVLQTDASGFLVAATDTGYRKVTAGTPSVVTEVPRAEVATGTNDHVVINGAAGALSSEAQLAPLRGGVPTGAMSMWGAAAAPTAWLLCDGAAVSRTTFAALFAVISTTYGVGDGSTTFNVPNMQGVVPRGAGSQTINARSKAGPALGATQEDQLQGHVHQTPMSALNPGGNSAVNTFRVGGVNTDISGPTTDGTNGTPRTGTETRASALGVNFIIKT